MPAVSFVAVEPGIDEHLEGAERPGRRGDRRNASATPATFWSVRASIVWSPTRNVLGACAAIVADVSLDGALRLPAASSAATR